MKVMGAGSAEDAAERATAQGRVRALDGLRGLAVAAVLAYHVAPTVAPGGFLGVDAFFVLSGFLLTSLLVDEHRRTDRIDRRAYAVRRACRLGPGLVALLATLIVVVPLLAPGDAHRLRGDVMWSLLGLTNWHLIANGSSYFSHLGRPPFVQHLWSVAVEIQFYAVCPWLVGWLVRRRLRVAVGVLAAGIAGSALAMFALYGGADPSRAYYGTDARLGSLLVGMLVAFVLSRDGHRGIAVRRRASRAGLVGPGSLVTVLLLVRLVHERSRWLYPFGFLTAELLVGVLIVAALRPGWLANTLSREGVRWLGQRSYGIYLWHWPVVVLLRPGVDVTWSPWVTALVTVTASLLLGALSYRWIEQPFLHPRPRRARRLAVAVRGVAATSLAIGLAVVLIRIPTTDHIAASLQAGQRVLASDPFLTMVPVAPDPTATSSPNVSQAVSAVGASQRGVSHAVPAGYSPQLSAPAPGTVPVTAVGDSVMLGAASALQARLGSTGYIDARVGRQFDEGIRVVRSLREQGRLGRVVIIHLGNNGTVRASQVDSLMHELEGVSDVLLVTVRVDASWQDSVNQTLRDAGNRYAKIKVVDWFSYSSGHGDWFWSDGTHLRPAGANAYADLLAGSIPPPPAPPATTTSTTATTAPPPTTTTSTTSTTMAPTTTSTTSTTLLAP